MVGPPGMRVIRESAETKTRGTGLWVDEDRRWFAQAPASPSHYRPIGSCGLYLVRLRIETCPPCSAHTRATARAGLPPGSACCQSPPARRVGTPLTAGAAGRGRPSWRSRSTVAGGRRGGAPAAPRGGRSAWFRRSPRLVFRAVVVGLTRVRLGDSLLLLALCAAFGVTSCYFLFVMSRRSNVLSAYPLLDGEHDPGGGAASGWRGGRAVVYVS